MRSQAIFPQLAGCVLLGAAGPTGIAVEGGAKPAVEIAALDARGLASATNNSLEQKEEFLRQALRLRMRFFGETSVISAAGQNNLALNLDSQSRFGEAEKLHRRALSIRQRELGEQSIDTAWSLNNLGINLCRQQRCAEGKGLIERALAVRLGLLGPTNAETLDAQGNLETAKGMLAAQTGDAADRSPVRLFLEEEREEQQAYERTITAATSSATAVAPQRLTALFPRYFGGFVRAHGGNGLSTADGKVTQYVSIRGSETILITSISTKLNWPSLWGAYFYKQIVSAYPTWHSPSGLIIKHVYASDGVTPIAAMWSIRKPGDRVDTTIAFAAIDDKVLIVRGNSSGRPAERSVAEFFAAMRKTPVPQVDAPPQGDACAILPTATAPVSAIDMPSDDLVTAVGFKVAAQFYPDAGSPMASGPMPWPAGIPFCLRSIGGVTVGTDPLGAPRRIDGYFMPIDDSGNVAAVTRIGTKKTAYGISVVTEKEAHVVAIVDRLPNPQDVTREVRAWKLLASVTSKEGRAMMRMTMGVLMPVKDPNSTNDFGKSRTAWLEEMVALRQSADRKD